MPLPRPLLPLALLLASARAATYINCNSDAVRAAAITCTNNYAIADAKNKATACAYYTKVAACYPAACCSNTFWTQGEMLYESSALSALNITSCANTCGGTATSSDIDCDSVTVSNIVFDGRAKMGDGSNINANNICDYVANWAAVIPQACCSTERFKSTMTYITAQLAAFKVANCNLICGQGKLSSAASVRTSTLAIVAAALALMIANAK